MIPVPGSTTGVPTSRTIEEPLTARRPESVVLSVPWPVTPELIRAPDGRPSAGDGGPAAGSLSLRAVTGGRPSYSSIALSRIATLGSLARSTAAGALEALVTLRDRGFIGHIGIAAGHVPTVDRLLDAGEFEVLLTHSRATLLDRSADPLIDRARATGTGVANAAVLGGGLLASRTAQPLYGFRPARPEILVAALALHDLADEFGIALADAAVQHSVRDEQIDTTVVGSSKPGRIPLLLESLRTPIPDDFWTRAEELLPDSALWLDAEDEDR